ncbi:DUF732 domain-containing protein [Mycobacterium sp. 852014-52144_SCH5372336]|uniref:DUF732 domain-containing protein n=1 Tax=Mycobacterium sp. 852014-52144_SCH5372336 TaxID=1834115 RepID=UPI0007FC2E14|nr:DUF732 domain-containing protein [Mycobacterium sp. 852014-52144_SCH5372336]OBB75899.1 hypothetical protein A5759_06545 [Mycobacterium sp. 852014-52144_SCH5372336]
MKFVVTAVIVGAALVLAAPAAADSSYDRDPDTDFAHALHTYGIYGQKDFNAWIGKLVCKRLYNNVDHNAFDSATFIGANLDRHNSTAQNWQFLGSALNYYCPDKRVILDQVAAAQH